MRLIQVFLVTLCHLTLLHASATGKRLENRDLDGKIAPKFFIISMFEPEGDIWYENMPSSGLGDLLAVNITIPGLSMLYPQVHCLANHDVCQVTTGEGEINAASSISAVVLSGVFDLRKTYFMISGIAGVSPKLGTLGSVALARYAVQVSLEYEFDAREMPSNFTTGYFGYGTDLPNIYPTEQYGSEVFEVNTALRDIAFGFAVQANLSDDPVAAQYRTLYAPAGEVYLAATEGPSVIKCDVVTSDVYYSGVLLCEAFDNVTYVWTNGSGAYCMAAQEDNGTLEAMVRAAIQGLVDFARIIVMRTGSDFDRQPPGVSAYENLLIVNQNGFSIAIDNIFNAGIEIVKGVLSGWDRTFENGISPTNYVGDIFGSLPGEPDFGPGSITDGKGFTPNGSIKTKRSLGKRAAHRRMV